MSFADRINHLSHVLHDFDETGLAPWLDDWRTYDHYVGKSVSLEMGGEHAIEGVYAGIDQQGCLLLQHAGGTRSYAGGEVSLRLQQAGS